jgi:hypothetical protein
MQVAGAVLIKHLAANRALRWRVGISVAGIAARRRPSDVAALAPDPNTRAGPAPSNAEPVDGSPAHDIAGWRDVDLPNQGALEDSFGAPVVAVLYRLARREVVPVVVGTGVVVRLLALRNQLKQVLVGGDGRRILRGGLH